MQSNSHSDLVSLWNKIELNSMKFNEGVLAIDVRIPDEARFGSGAELLALDALKETMFQFVEINNLELLIDGKTLECFMGHSELEHPISRNNQ
ncbi:GerMN domain-containing protein [Paenibacillus sp. GCM10027626]|uniref:GerMN domain-containing protein n=1 Tax=Paenibacillus sp. GCM10027626 TaxID=3273411 RepID=UPI00364039A6